VYILEDWVCKSIGKHPGILNHNGQISYAFVAGKVNHILLIMLKIIQCLLCLPLAAFRIKTGKMWRFQDFPVCPCLG